MGCMVPQLFAAGGNRSYPEFWTVTGNPWNMGCLTLTVAPEPSVERVVAAGHSMVGGIGGFKRLSRVIPSELTQMAWCQPTRRGVKETSWLRLRYEA
jgi:hypothetical protein